MAVCTRIGGIDAASKYYPARGPCTVEQLTTGIFLPNRETFNMNTKY
jgi:hypothetical protein